MQNSITHTVSIITFTHSGIDYKIIYYGPISAANVVVSNYYPGAGDRKGETTVFKNDLNKGDFQIIEIHSNKVVAECSNVTKQ